MTHRTATPLDTGSTDFGFTDQKGRACGYSWAITQVVYDQPTSYGDGSHYAAGEPIIELMSGPARDGHHYGPSNRVRVGTLEEARQIAVKRAEASRKRDSKKFVKEVA